MMMFNIFLPQKIENLRSGYIIGYYSHANCNTWPSSTNVAIVGTEVIHTEDESENVIGVISSKKEQGDSLKKKIWLILSTDPAISVISISVDGKMVDSKSVNLVLYEPNQILTSQIFRNRETSTRKKTSLEYLVAIVLFGYKNKPNLNHDKYEHIYLYFFNIFLFLCYHLKKFISLLKIFPQKICDGNSCFLDQVLLRCQHFEWLLFYNVTKKENLLKGRIIGMILMDIFLGIIFVMAITSWTSTYELHQQFQDMTKVLAEAVEELLGWLRGAPAGLKLNQPLTEALSSFFSYHVYLWTLYLDVASPVLQILGHLFVYAGLLGISTQVALMVDFLNLSVLHIHCFYIYAARLHMIITSLLLSQWRGFRGYKWNPLRQRVDSREQTKPLTKMITAVTFTLALFLIPTTVLYYSIFVGLRLCLLMIRGLGLLIIWALNWNPLYLFLLTLTSSPQINGELHYEVDRSIFLTKFRGQVTLKITAIPSDFKDVLAAAHSDDVIPKLLLPSFSQIRDSLIYAKELL